MTSGIMQTFRIAAFSMLATLVFSTGASAADCSAGIRFVWSNASNTTSSTDTQVAGQSFPIYLTAMSGIPCSIVTGYSGTKNVTLSSTYVDPVSGTLPLAIDIDNNGSFQNIPGNYSITFVNGRAAMNARYNDVGSLTLGANDISGGVSGNSDTFVVMPYDFTITEVMGLPSSVGTDETAAVFTKAGVPFTVKVEVRNSLGNRTPNYGQESTPAGIQLYSSSLLAPSGGRNGSQNDGTLLNGSAFSADNSVGAGAFINSSVAFDEVGIIALKAQVNGQNYLGAGNVITQNSMTVGRFTPDHFSVIPDSTPPNFLTSCNTFNYVGQPLVFQVQPKMVVTAMSAGSTTTQNYTGAFWKLAENISGTFSMAPINQPGFKTSDPATVFSTLQNNTASSSFAVTPLNGQATFVFQNDPIFSVARPIDTDWLAAEAAGSYTPYAPFTVDLSLAYSLTDTDGVIGDASEYYFGQPVAGQGIAFSNSNQMLYGRIRLINVSGSEVTPLSMPMIIEYINGQYFVQNTADSCTILTATPQLLSYSSNALTASILENKMGLAAVNVAAGNLGYFESGARQILITPGNSEVATSGFIDVTIDVVSTVPWLSYPITVSGTIQDNPVARAMLGTYNRPGSTIFTQELY